MRKSADIVNPTSEDQFERNFSDIAHSYLKDRAPGLIDYELGFQLIDKSDDDQRAAGTFAFKIGNQVALCPVFFLRGNIRGCDRLFLQKSKQFVPLKEAWVNMLINKKPTRLGRSVLDFENKPIRQPDLQSLSDPALKFAGLSIPEIAPGLADLAEMAVDYRTLLSKNATFPSLDEFLMKEGQEALDALQVLAEHSPTIERIFLDQYDGANRIKKVASAIKASESATYKTESAIGEDKAKYRRTYVPRNMRNVGSSSRTIPRPTLKSDLVEVITPNSVTMGALSEKQAFYLLSTGVTFIDKRAEEEVNPAYADKPLHLSSPDSTGVYGVLTQEGSFEKCLVLQAAITSGGRRLPYSVVIPTASPKNFIIKENNKIYVDQNLANDTEEFASFFQTLPEVSGFSKALSGFKQWKNSRSYRNPYKFVIVGPRQDSVCPFTVEDMRYVDGELFLDVRPSGYFSCSNHGIDYPEVQAKDLELRFSEKAGRIWNQGNLVVVPDHYRFLDISKTEDESYSSDSEFRLAKDNDVDAMLFRNMRRVKVAVHADGFVTDGKAASFTDTLVSLVTEYGLGEEQARLLLEKAADSKIISFLVKQGYGLQEGGPSGYAIPTMNRSPDIFGSGGTMAESDEQEFRIPSGLSAKGPMQPTPEPWLLTQLQRAAASGTKEVIDTSLIGGILRTSNNDDMIDRSLPDLMKAMNALGNIRTAFEWQGSAFKERYGSEEMTELEDGMKNVFEDLGDLTLRLSEKRVESLLDSESNDLSNLAR